MFFIYNKYISGYIIYFGVIRYMVKLIQLEYFQTVAESGSINQAAEKLYISQPSLSRAIKSLENELDVNLLIRTNSGVKLTPEGKLLYQQTTDILRRIHSLQDIKQQFNLEKIKQISIYNIFIDNQMFLDNKPHNTSYHFYENTLENLIHEMNLGICDEIVGVINNDELEKLKKENFQIEIIDTSPVYIHTRKPIISKDIISTMKFVHLPYDFYTKENVKIQSLHLNSLIFNSYYMLLKYLQNNDSFMLGHKWNIPALKCHHIYSHQINSHSLVHLVIISKKNLIDNNFIKDKLKTYCLEFNQLTE